MRSSAAQAARRLLVVAVILSACSAVSGIDSLDPGVPFIGDPAQLEIDGVVYRLGIDAGGCATLAVGVGGDWYHPLHRCGGDRLEPWMSNVSCVERESLAAEARGQPEPMTEGTLVFSAPPTCLIRVPTVHYGHFQGAPTFVCLRLDMDSDDPEAEEVPQRRSTSSHWVQMGGGSRSSRAT